jgi:hypothetical protein
VKRFNQTVELTLRKIFNGETVRAADWPEWLRAAEFAINTLPLHRNFSALQLVTGVVPRTPEVVILPFSIKVPDDARRKLEVGTVQEKIRNQMRDIRTAEAMQRAERAPPAKPQIFTEGQHIYVNNHRHPKSGAHSPEWVQSEATFLSYVEGNKSAIVEMPGEKLRKTAIRDIAPRNSQLVVRRVKGGKVVEKPHRDSSPEKKHRRRNSLNRPEPEDQEEQRPQRGTSKRRVNKTPKEIEHPRERSDETEPKSKRHKESKTAEQRTDHRQTEQSETKQKKVAHEHNKKRKDDYRTRGQRIRGRARE